ncbi:hypothetical protein LTR78_001419 [Recurvomyces mirabilis]|uniref:Uncharacterized protein n=1 Tax=Recurvomyces mirabilis TaxID=574656 RepID=A0AAE0WWT1_9PEZI|nr:hypothetical protein LTR78_001419 [Recurvomyces mirabilis]
MWSKSAVVLGLAAATAQAHRGQRHERQAASDGNSNSSAVYVAPMQSSSTSTQSSYPGSIARPPGPLNGYGSAPPLAPPYGYAPPSAGPLPTEAIPTSAPPSSSLPAYSSTDFAYSPGTNTTTEVVTAYSSPPGTGVSSLSSSTSVSEANYTSTEFSYKPLSFFGPSPVGPKTASSTAPVSTSTSTSDAPGTTGMPRWQNGSGSCQGATLNVLNASLDWWYATTFTDVASTLSVTTNYNGSTSWSLVPASTTFNVTSALASPSCSLTITESVGWQGTYSYYEGTCFKTATPVAASTSVVTVSAYLPLNETAGNAVNVTANTTSAGAFSQGTPFVYFSQYQVIHKQNTTHPYDGRPICAEVTKTFNLSEPFSFAYDGQSNLDGVLQVGANVTGDVNPALLGIVGQSTAVAGSWVAAPTVLFVVKKVLAAQPSAVPAAASGSMTLSSILQTITPSLPPGFDTQSAQGTLFGVGITVRVPESQPVLLLPQTVTTPTSTASPVTTAPGGASSNNGGSNNGGSKNGGSNNGGSSNSGGSNTGGSGASGSSSNNGGSPPNVGNLVSNVISAVQPTNALQVLSEAQAAANNPTAVAIAAGLGGGAPAANSGSGSSGGNVAVVGGTTFTVTPASDKSGGGSVVVAAAGSSATIAPGQSASVGGQTVSMPASGGGVMIGTGSGATFVSPQGSSSGSGGSSGANGGSGAQAALPAPVITVGGSTATAQANPAFVVGGQTVVPGGAPITVSGHTILVPAGATAVVVDGSTVPLAGPIASPTVFNVNSVPITAAPAGGFVIAGQTLQPGGSPVTVDGTTLSLAAGGTAVVVNGQTSMLSPSAGVAGAAAAIPLLTIGSQTFTANAATQFSLAPGATLTPGGQVVVSGTTISLANGATALVVNGKSQALSAPLVTPAPMIVVGGTAYQANAGSTYDVAGQILTPGGVITVSGSTISLASGASAVVINGKTTTLTSGSSPTTPNANMATITAPPVLTVDGSAFVANGASVYIIDGKTLTPGGAITISGAKGVETISLNSAANQLFSIVSGTTYSSMVGAMGAMPTGAPILTVNGQTYTAQSYDTGSGPTYVISGQTLTRGGAITITASNGVKETLSLEAAGTALDIITSSTTSISKFPGVMAVMPTAAPILTIGGQTFTAVNNGATYVISGHTLTPGSEQTVTIGGKTYIVSLAAQATLLEIMEEDGSGHVTATEFETLFPAQMTGSTLTNTVNMAATGASSTSGGGVASGTAAAATSQKASATSLSMTLSAAVLALSSFLLAVLL